MKQKLTFAMLLLAVLFGTSCKEEVLAPDISGMDTTEYLLNIGDKVTLAPSVKNLKGNTYSWWINGKKVSNASLSYIFEARQPGTFTLVFKAENKSGLAEQAFKVVVEEPINITFEGIFSTPNCKVLKIAPRVTGPQRDDYTYEWIVDNTVIGNEPTLDFIAIEPGNYKLQLTVKAGKQLKTTLCNVLVEKGDYVKEAYTVLEYCPAPAKQFNWAVIGYSYLWKYYEFPLPYKEFIEEATNIRKEKEGRGLSLGSWGGYATFQFDHTVANLSNQSDFSITGKFSNSEIPAIFVAYDKNKNGKPDDNEWYEIKGVDYGKEAIKDYEITYTYKKTEIDDVFLHSYFTWKDNQPESKQVEEHHSCAIQKTRAGNLSTKGFFPGYYIDDQATKNAILLDGWRSSFSRKGKRITKDVSNAVSFSQTLKFNISMAVDEKGESVFLPGIDFIKIQKVVYPVEIDKSVTPNVTKDVNMDEIRILEIHSVEDLHMK